VEKLRKKYPKAARVLLGLFIDDVEHDTLIGDFDEMYETLRRERGPVRAGLWYWAQAIRGLPVFMFNSIYWSCIMLKNYFITALRNMKRRPLYSFINITGLAIGILSSFLMLLWVQDELSYDKFHENKDNIYRITQYHAENKGIQSAVTHMPLVPAIKRGLPEVIKASRLSTVGRLLFSYGENDFYERRGIFADPEFFDIFSFPFIAGNPATALSDPYSIVINEDMASKYFGDENPLGKSLTVNHDTEYTVTGIIRNVPRTSHMQFSYVRPFHLYGAWGKDMESWNDVSYFSYVLLDENSSVPDVAEKITAEIGLHLDEGKAVPEIALQRLDRIHLYSSHFYYDFQVPGNIRYIYIFVAAALFILTIACINFINLTTARAGTRAKEIGMRKVAGAYRSSLVKQFFGESLLMSFMAYMAACAGAVMLLPVFNNLTGKLITFESAGVVNIFAGLLVISVITGILSGIYPALYLSSFHPVRILKGAVVSGSGGSSFRRALVVTQFAISIILIIGTGVVYNQLDFIMNKDLGYDKEYLVYIRAQGDLLPQYETVKNKLLTYPGISSVTRMDNMPTNLGSGTTGADWEGKSGREQDIQMQLRSVDSDFIEVFGANMAEGRFFSEDFPADTAHFVVNEAAAAAMGMEEPVGKWFSWFGRGRIIGVVKDFHFRSLHGETMPLFMKMISPWYRNLCIRISSTGVSGTIDHIESVWEEFAPGFPFEYTFLDEAIGSMYRAEQQIGTIFRYLTFLTVFIAALGLFGLASFTAEQRTREIGIRKALGASVPGIVMLFSREFVMWVLAANVIAWPVAWFVMDRWLQNFAYRAEMPAGVFVVSAILALVVALITVSFQSVKAALSNPVDSLRDE